VELAPAAIAFAPPNAAAAATTASTTSFVRVEPRLVFAVDVSGVATQVAVASHQID